MGISELREWVIFIGYGVRPQVAKQWFPGVKGQYKLAKQMRGYCANKAVAMDLRLSGDIAEALKYEAICERIYKDFPASVKW